MNIISGLYHNKLIIFWVLIFFYLLPTFFSVVQATDNSLTVDKEKLVAEQAVQLTEQHKQFKDIVNSVVAKTTDDSKAIANLTNVIYYLTLLMMFVTLVAPSFMFFLQNRQMNSMREMIELKTRSIETNFTDELMEVLKQKIDARVDNYGEFMTRKLKKQSTTYEDCLYRVEEVHLELLKQSKPAHATTIDSLFDWIVEQQRDYYVLLQLISPDTDETFTALGHFRKRGQKLPRSFLSLLRFLDKRDRLPGGSKIIAEEIISENFAGASLKQ